MTMCEGEGLETPCAGQWPRVRELADGGFASVYRVRRGDSQFALKWTRGVADMEQLQRVLLENQVQRALQHPNSMRLWRPKYALWRVMRMRKKCPWCFLSVSGGHYTRILSEPSSRVSECLSLVTVTERAAFSESEWLRIFVLLVEAVLELHARGYAHHDIKPHNILLSWTEPIEPVLTDFGSVAPVRTMINTSHDALELFEGAAQFSSAAYRAQELWEAHATTHYRGEIDGRSDVWALGCVLFAMAFGPFSPFEKSH